MRWLYPNKLMYSNKASESGRHVEMPLSGSDFSNSRSSSVPRYFAPSCCINQNQLFVLSLHTRTYLVPYNKHYNKQAR